MGKIVLEWAEKSLSTWRRSRLAEHYSEKKNFYVKHEGKVYVYKNRRVGTPVYSEVEGKWVIVGRVDLAGHIFIGSKDELSYAEYLVSPAGREASEKLFNQIRKGGK